MAYITNDAVTGVDARGIMEWREGVRACGSQSTFPATAVPTFEVEQEVLIWYTHDELWYIGEVVRWRLDSEGICLYQVGFTSINGPRMRNWYDPQLGCIQEDTAGNQETLRRMGHAVVRRQRKQRQCSSRS